MKLYFSLFATTSIIFLMIDGIWLGLVALPLYQNQVGHLMKTINLLPAIIFYLIYVAAMIFFIIQPNLDHFQWSKVLMASFFFGVACYATYDLTNMATLKDWSWTITILDVIWGGVVTMTTCTIVTYLFKLM